MKYIIYLTKNKNSKVNSRIYLGIHKTETPEKFDGYIGDGIIVQQANTFKYPKTPLQCAVKKYGVESFERTTLFIFDNIQDAIDKMELIVDNNFINSSFTYNTRTLFKEKPIYQYNTNGKIVKKWSLIQDCCDFYGYSRNKFINIIRNKVLFLNSYWSFVPNINISEYSKKNCQAIYLFNKEGKLLTEFLNIEECSKYLNCTIKDVKEAIKNQNLLNKYYISNKVTDQFIPKPRRMYLHKTFYVYNINKEFVGMYKGKELMNVIHLYSWKKISNIFSLNNNWYKDYYISLTKIDNVPDKYKKVSIDVYDKYGNFIENLNSLKELKEKYNIPNHKIKDIQQGNKYFENYIIKYSK